jgi:multiple sugar transport system permease protein
MASVQDAKRPVAAWAVIGTLTQGRLRERSPLATLLTYAFLLGCGAILIYPLLWMLASSVRSLEEIARAGLDVWPKEWHIENYATVFSAFPFWTYLKNSLLTTILPIIGTTLSSSLVAFAFARMRVPGRNLLFMIVLATMLLPGEVTLIPQFILFRNLGMINTLYPLILPSFFGSAFFIFMLRQFYARLPDALEEAAILDGASMLRIWWSIFLPLSWPALVAVGVMVFMGSWNNFFGPLIYVNSDKWKTLPVGLAGFQSQNAVQTHLMMAATVLIIAPCVVLYFFAQRAFIEGVTFSGSKEG